MANKGLRKILITVFTALCMVFSTVIALNGVDKFYVNASTVNTLATNVEVLKLNNSENYYEITYKKLNGEGSYTQLFNANMYNDNVQLLDPNSEEGKEFVEEGKKFVGWFDADYEKIITSIKDIGLRNATLYALYSNEYYKVTFVTDGSEKVQIVKVGDKANSYLPTKEGYVFNGWFSGNEKFNFKNPLTSDVTLTASWKELTMVDVENATGNDNIVDTSATEIGYISTINIIAYALLGVGVIFLGLAIFLSVRKKKVVKGEALDENI